MMTRLITRNSKTPKQPFEMLQYLKKYGTSSLAYSSLQEDVKAFIVPDVGYIAYSVVGLGTAVVLSDPICDNQNKKELIERFLSIFHDAIFIHISRETAKLLDELGYNVNEIGHETLIDPRTFTLKGSKKEFLRSQRNRARKDGVVVEEHNSSEVDMAEVKALSEAWIRTKTANHNELSFLVRPAVFRDEMDVRKFYAIKDNRVIGFVWFDPMYRNNKVIGYMANILRTMADVPYSINDYIILEALEVFKKEGIEQLSLGYSPMFECQDCGEFHYSKLQKFLFNEIFEHWNHVYAFKALAFHKRMYRPGLDRTREEKIYCASKKRIPLLAIVGIFRKIGLHPVEQTIQLVLMKIMQLITHTVNSSKRLLAKQEHQPSQSAVAPLADISTSPACCERHAGLQPRV